MKVSDNTSVSMPMRNLLSILAAVAIGVYSYFGIIERLNNIETNGKLMIADVEKNTEFRIKWPRGEMGSLPADNEQYMLLEFMAEQVESMQEAFCDGTLQLNDYLKEVKKFNEICKKEKTPFKFKNFGKDYAKLMDIMMTKTPDELFEWDDNKTKDEYENAHGWGGYHGWY